MIAFSCSLIKSPGFLDDFPICHGCHVMEKTCGWFSRSPHFDCSAGKQNLEAGWSQHKKARFMGKENTKKMGIAMGLIASGDFENRFLLARGSFVDYRELLNLWHQIFVAFEFKEPWNGKHSGKWVKTGIQVSCSSSWGDSWIWGAFLNSNPLELTCWNSSYPSCSQWWFNRLLLKIAHLYVAC